MTAKLPMVFLLGALAGFLAGACGGSKAASKSTTTTTTTADKATTPSGPQMAFVITTNKTINKGRPLHVVIRAVDLNTYLQDSYSTVAGKVVTPDDSVIGSGVIYPGHDTILTVPMPEKDAVAVYFLYTRPGSSWKMFVETPLPAATRISLGKNGVAKSEPTTLPTSPSTSPAPGKKSGMPKRRKLALVSGGVGVAGLLAGTGFGLLAESRWSQTSQYCNAANQCTSQVGVDLGNQAKTYGWIANVSFAIGVAGVATGAVLWFTTPKNSQESQTTAIAPILGPGQAGITVLTRF